jgi:extracellular elastinolytic metalloproteinase
VNSFFYTNLMHVFFFTLGFDEEAGNFQNLNRTGAGLGGDGVNVRIFNVALNGHATMRGRPDGKHGELRLGVMPGSLRHTALDPDVIIHEFTHGVTERLVGGPMNWRALEEDQSVALSVVFGDWVTNSPGGMRHFPYDASFPRGFGDLGSSPYDQATVCGEIWSAALMRMNRALGAALGDSRRGHEIGWQIVVDGLKLVQANPNLLQARDAILQALDDLQKPGLLSAADYQKAATAARAAFAATGMGPNAQANDTSLTGNVAG